MHLLAANPARFTMSARLFFLSILVSLSALLAGAGDVSAASESVYGPMPFTAPSPEDALQAENAAVSRSHLVLLNPPAENATRALVLVGGYGSDYRVFAPWLPALLAQQDLRVYGLAHDHKAGHMSAAARKVAALVEELEGVESLTVFAYSMGGLVAKAALHELADRDILSRYGRVELHTFGTPFGGYWQADLVRFTPGGREIMAMMGFPMASEIGSRTSFIRALARPLPGNVRFLVYDSTTDKVAVPTSDDSQARYEEVLLSAHARQRLVGLNHGDFFQAQVLGLITLN